MEEDDEIDVLGEFNLESLLRKDEERISSCYDGDHQLGLHCESQWMLDTTSQACWYDNKSDPQKPLGGFSAVDSCESNTWTDKERYLLEKGLELFGRSWSRLAQYIGTKNANQVKSYVRSAGSGCVGKSSGSTSSFGIDSMDLNFSELINDMDIPASMEEVIAVVSTAQPTVVLPTLKRDNTIETNIPSPKKLKSRLKKNIAFETKRRLYNQKPKEVVHNYNAEDIKVVLTDNKERDHIVLPNGEQVIRIRHGTSLSEDSDIDVDVDSDLEKDKVELPLEKKECQKGEVHDIKEVVVKVEEDSDLEKGKVELPLEKKECQKGEVHDIKEVVVKVEVDSDLEKGKVELPLEKKECQKGEVHDIKEVVVKVEVDSDLEKGKVELPLEKKECQKGEVHDIKEVVIKVEECFQCEEDVPTSLDSPHNQKEETKEHFVDTKKKKVSLLSGSLEQQEKIHKKETQVFKGNLMTPSGKIMTVVVEDMPYELNEVQDWLDVVYQLPPPTQEKVIDCCIVTEEEKLLHPEFFFKSRQVLQRYLKIRNHILDYWKKSKPNYVTKTSVRVGLKSCGDVNLISRIHAYLEQRGYINFGCDQCHYKNKASSQPTYNPHTVNGDKDVVDEEVNRVEQSPAPLPADKHDGSRSRKKKLPFDEISTDERSKVYNGKFTQAENICIPRRPRKKKIARQDHEGGYTLMHTDSGEVVQVQTSFKKVRTKRTKPVKLIHCKSHSAGNKAPYKVEMEVSALIPIDVHSHLSPKCEVIGLLGGKYRPHGGGVLSITVAVPCRTILSSNIHCDMCPVSQLESSEAIKDRGLSVVGWYHSHPEFDPSPSDTDIDTQNSLQSWFNRTGNPFVGLIISPYSSKNCISTYRCCHVIMEKGDLTPYKLDVTLTNVDYDIGVLRKSIEAAHKVLQNSGSFKPRYAYFKCEDSVKHYLRKARVEEDKIVQVIIEIHKCLDKITQHSSLVT